MKNWFVKYILNYFLNLNQKCCFPEKKVDIDINDKTEDVGDNNKSQCKEIKY